MKRIKDERLINQNLKNIRVAFLVQSIGIFAILVYDVFKEGLSEATKNPLWFVFIITVVVLSFLNINVSIDAYDDVENPIKPWPYYRTVIITAIIGFVLGLLQQFYGGNIRNSIIVGGVVFICFLVPSSLLHYLRKKRSKDQRI